MQDVKFIKSELRKIINNYVDDYESLNNDIILDVSDADIERILKLFIGYQPDIDFDDFDFEPITYIKSVFNDYGIKYGTLSTIYGTD